MSWYKTGTVNVINNSKIVTGINTKWTNPLIGVCSGQMLILQTQNIIEIYEIASIQSDTQLTLAKVYSGTSKTGITYEIPTSPKVSIEALALRVSEMLNYYQIQLDAWQTILTGDGDVTLTAPNGQVVTIRSQLSISNELVKLVEQSQGFAQSARESATTAANASAAASSSENAANSFVESARLSATASANSAEQSSNSAVLAQQSENNAKQSEQNAAKSAEDARQHASSIDISNFIKKTGEQQQSIDCSLDVKQITEQGRRVYSPNNKPTADDVGAIPAVKSVVNNSLIYESCVSIDVASLTVNGHAVITDVSDIHEQINQLSGRIYIVESYANGNGWYNVYSNGFIEQSDAQFIDTANINAVCSNFINLLKPMNTQNYGVSIDKISSGPWAQTEFAYADAGSTGFWLTSFTPSIAGRVLVRWTVRGY
ncbi:hypothetical protein A9G42_05720 [Gilliamella sp. Nev6-6]|uniref:hypothetical protein n=1 Tax=Gilliamella sp. Nev6-6 TaxID=3120252 RepID=UPI00080F589B|nr:hypothetical protein [Gilliamella apicola]OCG77402.1 hypothetical protein A9G42_05720 [Gilliamella apicola]